MFHSEALILESELRRAGSRGFGAEYDLYVRYSIEGGRKVESSMRVMVSSFRTPSRGQKISVFVDPKTNRAEDDLRPESYYFTGLGLLGATLLFFVGFYACGRVLRTLN